MLFVTESCIHKQLISKREPCVKLADINPAWEDIMQSQKSVKLVVNPVRENILQSQKKEDIKDSNKRSREEEEQNVISKKHNILTPYKIAGVRVTFSDSVIDMFKSWVKTNWKYPYPSRNQFTYMSEATGLTIVQIKSWFINYRMRKWKNSN